MSAEQNPAPLPDRLNKAANEIEKSDSTMPGYVELFREAADALTDLELANRLNKEAYQRLNQALEVAAYDEYQRDVDWRVTFEDFMKLPKSRIYVDACIAEWIDRRKEYDHARPE